MNTYKTDNNYNKTNNKFVKKVVSSFENLFTECFILKGLKIIMLYKITIDRHGLGEYEKSVVDYVFESSSPKDALRRVEAVYERCRKNNKRFPYNSKMFLEAVAISAETDLNNIK